MRMLNGFACSGCENRILFLGYCSPWLAGTASAIRGDLGPGFSTQVSDGGSPSATHSGAHPSLSSSMRHDRPQRPPVFTRLLLLLLLLLVLLIVAAAAAAATAAVRQSKVE